MTWYCFALSPDRFTSGALVLAVGLGCAVMGYALRRIVEGSRAAHWPQTTGMVLSLGSRINAEQVQEVVVRYAYSVDDQTYEGSRAHSVYRGVPVEDEVARKAVEAALAPGKKVRVHYRADDSATSMLVVGFFSASLPHVFWGSGFAALPLGFLFMAAIAEENGSIASIAGRIVFAVTALVFLTSWSLALWFAVRGNRDIAAGITFQE